MATRQNILDITTAAIAYSFYIARTFWSHSGRRINILTRVARISRRTGRFLGTREYLSSKYASLSILCLWRVLALLRCRYRDFLIEHFSYCLVLFGPLHSTSVEGKGSASCSRVRRGRPQCSILENTNLWPWQSWVRVQRSVSGIGDSRPRPRSNFTLEGSWNL